jgi:ribonuclease D
MMMFEKEITKEEINQLEVKQFEGTIHVVDSKAKLKQAVKDLKGHPVLGFDTETKPAFRKGVKHDVALIQISNRSEAWLFRVNRIGFHRELRRIFEDERLLKVGAGLKDDLQKLNAMGDFSPAGFIDLQKYVEAFGIESKSLKKLTAIVLGYKISKSQQTSNWEADQLTEMQQRYAATDAWVCLEIYHALRNAIPSFQ